MPWKINHETVPQGAEAQIHFEDRSVDLHMVVGLIDGVIDLYIGSDHMENAAIYLEIDPAQKRPIDVVRVANPSNRQASIIDNVLGTLNYAHTVRTAIQNAIRASRKEARIVALEGGIVEND